jgi:hypothetical protein
MCFLTKRLTQLLLGMASTKPLSSFLLVWALFLTIRVLGSYDSTGTPVTWGVNLGGNNLTDAFLMTQSIVKAFESDAIKEAGITLDSLEVGNEPDLFGQNGHRPADYSVQDWVSE